MQLWKELLINGLQNSNEMFECLNDKVLNDVIESRCYKVLLSIKQAVDDEKLSDNDCFFKIEKIITVLEENGIFCERHDFG